MKAHQILGHAGPKLTIETSKAVLPNILAMTRLVEQKTSHLSVLKPIQAIGRTIGKLFLPLTIILGIFDGVSGFMKEYENTGSIVDGIRGAVVGIIDGFIGHNLNIVDLGFYINSGNFSHFKL